ncbi:hypothetical protein CO058_02160 [candidate division WWE3 bacterium CG_4_9_14_0_2_um_filter_35_11]|uniref:Insulinase family protein n=1 Tax=candidate division WWE3 bacterium CG_4_9_14_0_2_um_filter_35_11 TaxID=1975077 RepID=A0A2M8ELN7_UNCKA|nr:MAG: hypothetical protein COV25_00560 [candidate division WWE3 bacterium CG10_big_fil_rev_8_21_14_0_10_35_32]PJC23654.1 MAG: hypothetical protein CO058_02160 [candidate division WWE3 bacterium CG_4_9_14_0_2_um_filter_35_11]
MIKINYEFYKLANGIEVLLIPNSETYSLTIKSYINSGSALENEKEHGITHFIEHLCSSATEKWPTKESLNETIEFNGGDANAWTSKEAISYYINVPYNKADFGLEYIYQVLFHPKISEEAVEKEKIIILDELSKNMDDVGYRNNSYTTKVISIMNSGYVHEILGTEKSIISFNYLNVEKKIKELHDPSKLQLLIVGNFDVNKTKTLIDKYFNDIKSIYPKEEFPNEKLKKSFIDSGYDNETRLITNTLFFNTPGDIEIPTKQDLQFDVISKIIAGPNSSRLNKRLREKESLLYYISCTHFSYKPFGIIGVYYESIQDQFEKTFNIVIEELKKLAEYGVSKSELNHITEYICNRNLVHYDNIHSYSKLISSTLLNGKEFYELERMNETIKNFSVNEINKSIKQYINLNEVNSIAYGKIDKETTKMMEQVLSKK